MHKKLFFSFSICLALSACSTSSPVVVTNKNYQTLCSPLSLKKNETLIIKLPSSQFSGYKWELVDEQNNILQLLSNNRQNDKSAESNIHKEETSWEYKAVRQGKTTLSFTYQLAWDTDIQQSQRVDCPITVRN